MTCDAPVVGRFLYAQLQKYPVITKQNQQVVVECLRAIAELMIWGDQHNAGFFEWVELADPPRL